MTQHVYPWYKRMLRGSSLDPNELSDFTNRRTARSKSAIPENAYIRDNDESSVPNYNLVSRALAKGRDTIFEEPLATLALDSGDLYDPNDVLTRMRATRRQDDDYWLNRYHDLYPSYSTPTYTRRYPLSYYLGYPSTLYSSNYYPSRHWSLSEPLFNYNYGISSYYKSSSYPYSSYYRPCLSGSRYLYL